MAWFKVDDSFWSHPKVLPLSLAARGVWLTAGTWCATHLTDGAIDDESLHVIIPGSRAQVGRWAAELVTRGLWDVTDTGWRFHSWEDFQPSREQVEAARIDARERQRRSREHRRSKVTP